MLKATLGNETWMVQQHHHAQVSGFLAAHWGGANGFARPGHYPGATHPGRWRDEVVLGIAEHDNGWWETEAMPLFSGRDGLPVGVGEAAAPTLENEFAAWSSGGFDRWRSGIHRVAATHPYGALLTSLHAYWLYAVAFEDLLPGDADYLRHFVFGPPEVAEGLVADPAATRVFLREMRQEQDILKQRVASDPALAGLIEPEHLNPHIRLTQLMDTLSLYLSLNDTDEHLLPEVPRGSWDDRVILRWTRRDERVIELDPFPFDTDGLEVHLPARVVSSNHVLADREVDSPITRLHAMPLDVLPFKFVSC